MLKGRGCCAPLRAASSCNCRRLCSFLASSVGTRRSSIISAALLTCTAPYIVHALPTRAQQRLLTRIKTFGRALTHALKSLATKDESFKSQKEKDWLTSSILSPVMSTCSSSSSP